jgi:hypothetical protein
MAAITFMLIYCAAGTYQAFSIERKDMSVNEFRKVDH